MSLKKKLEALSPGFGEGFIEDFNFSSMFSNSINYEDTVSVRGDKDYIHGEFIEEDLIKSKFCATKNSLESLMTKSNQSSIGSKKTWGWSTVKYDALEKQLTTPMAK